MKIEMNIELDSNIYVDCIKEIYGLLNIDMEFNANIELVRSLIVFENIIEWNHRFILRPYIKEININIIKSIPKYINFKWKTYSIYLYFLDWYRINIVREWECLQIWYNANLLECYKQFTNYINKDVK